MADGTNFDIAIAASAKTDALKSVRAEVDALKNSTLALAPAQKAATAAGEGQRAGAQGVALASRAGREATNAYALLLSGNYVMAAEKARFVTVGLTTAMRATPWGAVVFGATLALTALGEMVQGAEKAETQVEKTGDEVKDLGEKTETAAGLAEELVKQLAAETEGAKKAQQAISDLADAELKLAMAQNRETELGELQKAGGDPVKMAQARAAAAKRAADLKFQAETNKAYDAVQGAAGTYRDTIRKAGLADNEAGKAGRTESAARQEQGQAQRNLDEVQKLRADLGEAMDRVKQAEIALTQAREKFGAYSPEAAAAQTAYGDAAVRRQQIEDRAAGRNLPEEEKRYSGEVAAARGRGDTAQNKRENFAATAAQLRAEAERAAQAYRRALVGQQGATSVASADLADAYTAAERLVRDAESAAAKKALDKATQRKEEQARADEAAAARRSEEPAPPSDTRTAKQKSDDEWHDRFRPRGLRPTNSGTPSSDERTKAELMEQARQVLGGEGADKVMLEVFRKMLERTQAIDRAAETMRKEQAQSDSRNSKRS